MKSTLSVLMIVAAGIVRANGDAVSCSVIDYLYYSSDCCDGSNSVQCMESIPQTDKAAIDNLASLKRSDGAACQSGDGIEYYSDGANFTGLVCKEGVAVDCVFTWSNYTACAGGSKSRTSTVTTQSSGSGTACPTSPYTAVCTGAIGASCTANEHCASGDCDVVGTAKCVVAPTFTLVTDNSNFNVNDPKLIDNENDCMALQPDAALLTALVAYESTFAWDATDPTYGTLAAVACASYPKGCFVRISNGKIYWSAGLGEDGITACGTTSPISSTATSSKVPVLLP